MAHTVELPPRLRRVKELTITLHVVPIHGNNVPLVTNASPLACGSACPYTGTMLRESYRDAPTRCLVLDLDGTLVDSVPDLATCLNRLMAARGLAGFAESEVAGMVGDGAAALVARAFAAHGREAGEADVASLVADYTQHAAEGSRLYPGVEDTLAEMKARGWRLAVCTNKPAAAARVVLQALGIDARFDVVAGGDSFPVRKPDPQHLLATLAAVGTVPARAVMLGDHRNDVTAAAGAGVPCIFAAWGYGTPAMAEGAAAIAHALAEVPELARRLMPE